MTSWGFFRQIKFANHPQKRLSSPNFSEIVSSNKKRSTFLREGSPFFMIGYGNLPDRIHLHHFPAIGPAHKIGSGSNSPILQNFTKAAIRNKAVYT